MEGGNGENASAETTQKTERSEKKRDDDDDDETQWKREIDGTDGNTLRTTNATGTQPERHTRPL